MDESGDRLVASRLEDYEESTLTGTAKHFGDYISSQYELLERTLSFLNVTDLMTASLVCKSWNEVVHHIFRKRERHCKFYWHIRSKKICSPSNYLKNNITLKSQFVLGFQVPRSKNMVVNELMETNPKDSRMVIPGLFGDAYIVDSDSLIVPSYSDDGIWKLLRNEAAAIFFPKITGCKVIARSVHEDTDLLEFAHTLQSGEYGPLKGVLLFSRNVELNKEQQLFDIVSDNAHLEPFVLAGGIFPNVQQFIQNKWIGKGDIINVCFYGENVNCYSDILCDERKSYIEPFMKSVIFLGMRSNLKEIDLKKQCRIAIVIRCNGRRYGKYEDELFQKYFPLTPAFIMVSYGECGLRVNTDDDPPEKKVKMGKMNILHTFSTIYFFVTINIPN